MIPKIIHYCWLSKDPYPENIQKCIDSWKKFLPDYEIWLWNFDRFPRGKSKWVDQAFERRKYAFAADYIRLYALYNYGGIYLDSDVEVLKSFDDLLRLPYFIGVENTPSGVEAATIGCAPGFSLMKIMLERYEGRTFVKRNGDLDILPLPFVFRQCIECQFHYNPIISIEEFDFNEDCINVFPVDWFSPKTWDTKELKVTSNTYSIHHFAGSWLEQKQPEINDYNEGLERNELEKKSINIVSYFRLQVKEVLRKFFKRRNVIVLSKSYFAESFCGFFEHPEWNVFSQLNISATNMREFAELLVKNRAFTFHFVTFLECKERYYSDNFYPVAIIDNTDIELHLVNCDSKESAVLFLEDFLCRIKTCVLVNVVGTPKWNLFTLLQLCFKINKTDVIIYKC